MKTYYLRAHKKIILRSVTFMFKLQKIRYINIKLLIQWLNSFNCVQIVIPQVCVCDLPSNHRTMKYFFINILLLQFLKQIIAHKMISPCLKKIKKEMEANNISVWVKRRFICIINLLYTLTSSVSWGKIFIFFPWSVKLEWWWCHLHNNLWNS